MTLKQTKQSGFTIVELLIVVVIIAILAAITIVAYNGIQNRAKASSALAAASSLQKKAEAYNVDGTTSAYPLLVADMTGAASTTTYHLPPAAVVVNGTALTTTAPTDPKTINYYKCNAGKGYQITYYDYNTSTTKQLIGGDQTTCTIVAS